MAGVSNYLSNNILDWLKGGTAFTPPATTYFALMTTMPTASGGGVEVSGGSYARVGYTNSAGNWPASSGGSKTNANVINFGTATANWGTVVGIAEYDAATSGNLLTFAIFTGGPITILNGTPFSIPATAGNVFVQLPSLSTYLANRLNDWLHGGGAYTVPGTTYVSAMTVLPGPGGSGPSGTESAFSRVSFTNNPTDWPAASGQTKTNGVAINFGTAGVNMGTIVGIAEYDASTSGNLLTFGVLTNPQAVNSGQPFQIPINGATYQCS